MRVAFVLYGALTQRTGGTIYDRLVVEGLRARGAAVDVVSIARGEVVREPDCDVVVGDELCFRELLPFFRATKKTRVLLVHHLTSWEEGGAWAEPDERALLEACDLRIATSTWTAARIGGASVVAPGADRLPLAKRTRTDDSVCFLAIGDAPRKRLHLFTPRADVTVARGDLDDDALAQAIADADALVAASSLEGYGMAVAEALRAGLPVIATPHAAAPPLLSSDAVMKVSDGEIGAAMDTFARDAALRARMREAARHVSLPRWSDAVTAFSEALRAAHARGRGATP
jgi:hypothetical protein